VAVSEADVDEPARVVEVDKECAVVEVGTPPVVAAHATRDVVDTETELSQQPAEGAVEFEAPATASAPGDFRNRPGDIGTDWATVIHIEILERDSDQVAALQLGEQYTIGNLPDSVHSQPVQIRIHMLRQLDAGVDHVPHGKPSTELEVKSPNVKFTSYE
jgi:hypothetical protein